MAEIYPLDPQQKSEILVVSPFLQKVLGPREEEPRSWDAWPGGARNFLDSLSPLEAWLVAGETSEIFQWNLNGNIQLFQANARKWWKDIDGQNQWQFLVQENLNMSNSDAFFFLTLE